MIDTGDVYLGSVFVSFVAVWTAFMVTSPLDTFLMVSAPLAIMLFCVIVWGSRRETHAGNGGE